MKIGYARVSKKKQDPYMQIKALEEYGCEKIFLDNGLSGENNKRPELMAMKEMVRKGDDVVVWKIDRLGRSMRELVNDVEWFKEKEINFVSLKDNIDTRTPMGKLFFYVNSIFAEMERELISERTKEGLRAAKSRGVKLGRRPIAEDEKLQKKMEVAYMMKKQKKSVKQICEILQISRQTFNRYYKEVENNVKK